ncbi:MAG: 30S ribosomal protein S5 [Spirochaetales bacterium]|nr:30S ribosomal protein S5 [Spirochaetales bacterium]
MKKNESVAEPQAAPEAVAEERRSFRGREGRGDRRFGRERREPREKEFFEKTLKINRCSKTVKGGRRQSFSAIVIAGDQKGKVGYGFGKANDVSEAVKKATEKSKEKMVTVNIKNGTIPHEIIGQYKSATVVLKPAAPGTGVIAGNSVRAVCEACGITDVLSKSLGSKNAINNVKATFDGLEKLMSAAEIAKVRGKSVKEIWG